MTDDISGTNSKWNRRREIRPAPFGPLPQSTPPARPNRPPTQPCKVHRLGSPNHPPPHTAAPPGAGAPGFSPRGCSRGGPAPSPCQRRLQESPNRRAKASRYGRAYPFPPGRSCCAPGRRPAVGGLNLRIPQREAFDTSLLQQQKTEAGSQLTTGPAWVKAAHMPTNDTRRYTQPGRKPAERCTRRGVRPYPVVEAQRASGEAAQEVEQLVADGTQFGDRALAWLAGIENGVRRTDGERFFSHGVTLWPLPCGWRPLSRCHAARLGRGNRRFPQLSPCHAASVTSSVTPAAGRSIRWFSGWLRWRRLAIWHSVRTIPSTCGEATEAVS